MLWKAIFFVLLGISEVYTFIHTTFPPPTSLFNHPPQFKNKNLIIKPKNNVLETPSSFSSSSSFFGGAKSGLVRDHFNIKWRKNAEMRSLHPVNLTALHVNQEAGTHTLMIRVYINSHHVEIYRDEEMIYEKNVDERLTHSGIHLLALDSFNGELLMARQFLTHQPSEHRNFAICLHSLMPGRILILAAVPDAAVFLAKDAIFELEAVGASLIRNLAAYETWALVTHTPSRPFTPTHPLWTNFKDGKPATPNLSPPKFKIEDLVIGRTWGEAASIIRRPDATTASPLMLSARVPKIPDVVCAWHSDFSMEDQREFCHTYEGYARLCSCQSPIIPSLLRHSAAKIEIKEVIPVAMLTAIKPFNFYRQLINLLETPGAAQTPIVVMIDGPHTEITRLARLFGLDVLVHRPQGKKGTATLLNMHFRFSVHNVFNHFPNVDKAVILEDDLILSPDFLSFFQQTAWLLDTDPTISYVNAFSLNSYPSVANDPTTLRRVDMYPQFGWMITRNWALEMFNIWIPEDHTGDWDWWLSSQNSLRGRHAVVPEVGRTYHAGAAGAHVTGWTQEHLFQHMVYNTDPNVKLHGLEDLTLERYDAKMKREILRASDVILADDPCEVSPLPQDKPGPFRIFVRSETKSDEYGSFYILRLCLHAFTEDTREIFNGVMQFNVKGRILYIIGCPASPYCGLLPEGVVIHTGSRELIESADHHTSLWQMRHYPPYFQQRAYARTPEKEYAMGNLLRHYFNGTVIEV